MPDVPTAAPAPGNRVLAALDPEDFAAVSKALERRTVTTGDVLIEQNAIVRELHFPVTATLSNVTVLSDTRVETAMVGREGVSALAAVLAGAPCSWEVLVQQSGIVDVLPVAAIADRLTESPKMLMLMLRLTHDYQSQAAQTAACNAVHEVTQRVARWLLMTSDRIGSARLEITQEQLAMMVGSQRTTVNEGVARLKDLGAVRQRRGAVEIENRAALERAACECYRMDRERSRDWAILP